MKQASPPPEFPSHPFAKNLRLLSLQNLQTREVVLPAVGEEHSGRDDVNQIVHLQRGRMEDNKTITD